MAHDSTTLPPLYLETILATPLRNGATVEANIGPLHPDARQKLHEGAARIALEEYQWRKQTGRDASPGAVAAAVVAAFEAAILSLARTVGCIPS